MRWARSANPNAGRRLGMPSQSRVLTCATDRPKVRYKGFGRKRKEVHQGRIGSVSRTASRVDRSNRRNPRRVRVFSVTMTPALDFF